MEIPLNPRYRTTSDRNLKSLESVLNAELLKICNWLTANKLSLNVKKSHFVIFHPYQRKLNYLVDLKMFDNDSKTFFSLEHKNCVKYLGILIDSNLVWKNHISHVALKINKTIGTISKIRHFVPRSTSINIYKSLILPHLSYGIVVWGQAAKIHLEKVLKLQKRVLRLIYFEDHVSHAIPLFLSSKILPVQMLYFKLLSTLIYDVHNNLAPRNISQLFTYSKDIHNYNTRSSSNVNLYAKHARLNILNNSFSRTGARIWNSIPGELCNLAKNKFKERVHQIVLQVLSEGDDYVDLITLIKQVKIFNHVK